MNRLNEVIISVKCNAKLLLCISNPTHMLITSYYQNRVELILPTK